MLIEPASKKWAQVHVYHNEVGDVFQRLTPAPTVRLAVLAPARRRAPAMTSRRPASGRKIAPLPVVRTPGAASDEKFKLQEQLLEQRIARLTQELIKRKKKHEEFFEQKAQRWRLTFDETAISARRRNALGMRPLEEAISKLAPPEMLAAQKTAEEHQHVDPTGTTVQPPSLKTWIAKV